MLEMATSFGHMNCPSTEGRNASYPTLYPLGVQRGVFSKVDLGFWNLGMTSEGFGEMFECTSADTCAGKFPIILMGGRANGQACADGERGPPSAWAKISYSKQSSVTSAFYFSIRTPYVKSFISNFVNLIIIQSWYRGWHMNLFYWSYQKCVLILLSCIKPIRHAWSRKQLNCHNPTNNPKQLKTTFVGVVLLSVLIPPPPLRVSLQSEQF